MENCFFEQEFDLEKYIEKQLLTIENEDNRERYREFLEHTMTPFYRQAEEMYAKLDTRFQKSNEGIEARYEIITGLVNKKELDISDLTMSPMKCEDIEERRIDSEELFDCIEQGNAVSLMKVYAKISFSQIQKLERENRVFQGTIKSEYEEYKAEFRLCRNMDYAEQVKQLYLLFEENGVEWKTVCAPYIYKFFDVQLVQAQWPRHEKVESITVDFQEYQDVLLADMIPIWNIRCIEEMSSAYPNLIPGQVRYEHCIYKNRLQNGKDYLVGENKVKVLESLFLDGDLHLICEEAKPRKWKLIEFNYEGLKKENKYATFSNGDKFLGNSRCINTYGMLKNFVHSLGYEKYMKLIDVRISEQVQDIHTHTYDMDGFIGERIVGSSKQEVLKLVFQPTERCDCLQEDIMSYLVSRVQWQMPQFQCIGEWM